MLEILIKVSKLTESVPNCSTHRDSTRVNLVKSIYRRTPVARTPLEHEHMFEIGVVRANEG